MPTERPNVVVVLSDQHRGMALGCAGNDDIETPNFDDVATAGTRFEHAYANDPVCSPNRACLISGQYPLTHGVVSNDLPMSTDATSIAEAFRDAGYRTGYVGKWHIGGAPRNEWIPPGPDRHGFDDYFQITDKHDYYNAKYYGGDDPEPIEVEGYEPEWATDRAIEFVEEESEPFCLFVSWGPPHDPYELVPDRYLNQYDPDELSMRENAEPLLPGASDHPASASLRGPPVKEWGPTTSEEYETGWRYEYDDQREMLAKYYAAITALDDQFGRLLDALDRTGTADDTVVCYTADHGDLLYSNGLNQKGYPHEESINVPFLVRWPDTVPAGRVADTLLSTVDIAPSLLSLAGIDPPDAMEGTDCSGAMRGENVDGPDSVFLMGGNWRGVRTERYTYARVPDDWEEFQHVPGGRWLLFDNEEDPYQFNNVVLDAAYGDVVDRLDSRLDEWLDHLEDPFVSTTEAIRRLGLVDEYNEAVDYHAKTKAEGLPGEPDVEYIRERYDYHHLEPESEP